MGVYIKGMEMPTAGYIDVRIKCNGTASFAIADNPYIKVVEAVPVQPHGRLIDADHAMNNMRSEHPYVQNAIRATISVAPTIIRAEEGE